MRDVEALKARKKELDLTNQEIADLSGVPLGTVQKVFSGATRSPGSRTLLAIERALFPKDAEDYPVGDPGTQPGKESAIVYGTKKKWEEDGFTYADYAALPDDRRVELIDGRFYDMAAPTSRHQIIIGQLFLQFQACADGHPECMVLLSPLDVMLDCDDRTVVQPDLIVTCDRSSLRKGRIFGAPDLLVEVVSPGSSRMDYGRKTMKYIEAGVREYWIIDEKRGRVLVHRMDEEVDVALFGMRDRIPIGISDRKCRIDMKKIADLLEELGDI